MHPIFWLMPVENTFWSKSKYRFQHISTDFIREVRNLWILEVVTDKRSVNIGIVKSMIKLLEKFLWRSFSAKATGNSRKILLKMNFFTNICHGFQTIDLTWLLYKTAIFKKQRGFTHPAFTCSNSIELTSTIYKDNNIDTIATSLTPFWCLLC